MCFIRKSKQTVNSPQKIPSMVYYQAIFTLSFLLLYLFYFLLLPRMPGNSLLVEVSQYWKKKKTQASTVIVHLVWHMVRTPILPLSPDSPIFSLIRRNISSFWGEYFISLMSSCDVDIASTRRLASACCSPSHSTRGFQNVVRLSRF